MGLRRTHILAAISASAALFGASPAVGETPAGIDILREWNLVVLGDLDSSSEVEGRTFVGGNLTGNSSNYNIAAIPASANGQAGLTVVGNVTGGVKNLNNGAGAVIGGNVDSGFNLNGNPQTVLVGGSISNTNVNANTVNSGLAGSDPQFIQDLQQQGSFIRTSTQNLSYDLSMQAANSDFVKSGNRGMFNAQPDADGTAVFNIAASDLNSIGEIEFNLNGADTAIINVSGKNIKLDDNFLGGTNNLGENVIWNFPEAERLTASTAWGGSVLAPKASATTYNYIQGSAVFGSLGQYGEMHVGTYSGGYYPPDYPDTPGGSSGGTPIPEPGMLGLLGLGLAGLAFMRRRRKLTSAE
ncbi:choice-of-anchor A domain-containing protein [Altererythrobacter atlanticus]|uniref:PEP-CTERM motif protein n=1 Tax=Croceibacterium atlanticum TaxID=1267766 RepID=A0A0F7KRX4_9SPHN|nr:choice-of-anchor A family protein [Croceibacterium atlanticum]AKH42344.1 PEP-CTERM motif protein [Croceibacterium atlanticum]MBB5731121.1 choice-of-anchor A domain-containing protein [Croceibacterium atlanticum]